MAHIVDRRLNPQGKSLSNRQKFLDRAKAQVRKAVNKKSAEGSIEDVIKGGDISIPLDGIEEPTFHHGSGGIRDRVLPGNKEFVEGDILPRPNPSGGKGSGAGEGDSVDQFRFVLTRDEFADIFLSDLELPDLVRRKLVETESEGLKRAGYSTSGSPANMSIGRTSQVALQRRVALGRPTKKEIEEQRERVRIAAENDEVEGLYGWEESVLARLLRRAKRVPWIDTKDVRYRRFDPQPKPNSQAVMFCLMDVSGSMTEHMKDLAKRFYMLLYFFLTRQYGQNRVKLVFIRHTDHAEEVDEKTFFYDPASGGTLVSSALVAMKEIIQARFNPADWNIYAAQASDGDNSYSDSDVTEALMVKDILPLVQYFAYLEVGQEVSLSYGEPDSSLWKTYQSIKPDKWPLAMRKVKERSQIFPVFRELFKKRLLTDT